MLNPKSIFHDALQRLLPEVFAGVLPVLRQEIPGGGVSVVLFDSEKGADEKGNKKVVAKFCREDMVKALKDADPDQYLSMLDTGMEPLPALAVREKLAKGFGDGALGEDANAIFAFLMEERPCGCPRPPCAHSARTRQCEKRLYASAGPVYPGGGNGRVLHLLPGPGGTALV